MKKMGYLLLGLFAFLLVDVQVNAAAVTDMTSLESCLKGATGSECTLQNDVTTSSQIVLESATAKEITLNLNGKTLTLNGGQAIKVGEGYTLTVTGNGKVVGGGTATYLFAVAPNGTLILENGTYTNNYEGGGAIRLIGSDATDTKTNFTLKADATIEGNYALAIFGKTTGAALANGVDARIYGTVKGLAGFENGAPGITVSGNIKTDVATIPQIYVYEGAVIKGAQGTSTDENEKAGPAVYAAGRAKWTIMGGTFEGSEALSIKAGEFNITGGTFKAIGGYVTPDQIQAEGSGSEATGAAISITGNDGYAMGVVVNIENATVTSENGYAIFEGITRGVTPAVKGIQVVSGEYSGKEGSLYAENSKSFVSGGEFSDNIDEKYLATDEIEAIEQEDGSVVVGVPHTITVATVKNGKVVVDKTVAVAGQEVTITSTPDKGYKVGKVEIALADASAGGTVEASTTKFVMPNGDVVVTVTFVQDVSNPATSDSLMMYIAIAIMSVAGLSVVAFNKKRFN